MHAGFSPAPLLDEADVILVVESDVPWYPDVKRPSEDCKVIHWGIDPLYSRYPMRSFPRDLAIRADPATAIRMLDEALSPRREEHENENCRKVCTHQRPPQSAAGRNGKRDGKPRDRSPLDPVRVSHCINEISDEKTVIVNDTTSC